MERSPETCEHYRETRRDALGPSLRGGPERPGVLCWCTHPDSPVDRARAREGTTLLSCGGDLDACELPPGIAEAFVRSVRRPG